MFYLPIYFVSVGFNVLTWGINHFMNKNVLNRK